MALSTFCFCSGGHEGGGGAFSTVSGSELPLAAALSPPDGADPGSSENEALPVKKETANR